MSRKQVSALTVITLIIVSVTWFLRERGSSPGASKQETLHILAYSTFVNSWGPGPGIAKEFERRTGVKVIMQDAGDAGLILKKLPLLPADVVVGLDQLTLTEARKTAKWREVEVPGLRWRQPGFVPFNWGPLAFVVRKGEIEPPASLDALLDPRFSGKITLQDPRTSTPGLQFLLWVLQEKGLEGGFEFLGRLKPNIHTVASSWSGSYGIFQKKIAAMTFSYLTSPVYHLMNENDGSYQAVLFASGHPYQVEYMAIPESCKQCARAEEFVRLMLEPAMQKHIMNTNFMLPIIEGLESGSPFAQLPRVRLLELSNADQFLSDQEALFNRWSQLEL